ncbi:E3 ubiquitin-protein ligase TRIM56-like [Patella vulgata]|uniref:E3 ubiquitin-protein ligase TRIM56-like n=1 Tax=Patella vulgata TaxID=6465 RepID=UPI00217F3B15|nr:E3 ubiquitin-protein ligase TRIM56-like [Patella vulgata]
MAESTDKLICSICLNEFKQPKLIDCQHAFCLTCLEDYVNKVSTDNCFPCPLCCHYVSVPGGGVGEFPANLDIAERPVCKMEIPPCDVCKTGVISECRCQDCQQHLSNSCKTIHDSLRGCQDHVLVNMDDAIIDPSSDESDLHFKDVCPNHYEKEVRCYCKGCSLAVCSDCFVTSHSSHIFVDLHSDEIDAQTRRELKS